MGGGKQGATESLAQFIARTRWEDISEAARERLKIEDLTLHCSIVVRRRR